MTLSQRKQNLNDVMMHMIKYFVLNWNQYFASQRKQNDKEFPMGHEIKYFVC